MMQIANIAKDISYSLFNDYLVAKYSANSHQERTEKSTVKDFFSPLLNGTKSYYFSKFLKPTLKRIFHLQTNVIFLKNKTTEVVHTCTPKKTCKLDGW